MSGRLCHSHFCPRTEENEELEMQWILVTWQTEISTRETQMDYVACLVPKHAREAVLIENL